MGTTEDMRHQVVESLEDSVDSFDVDGIVAEIKETHGLVDVDLLGGDEYWRIVWRYMRVDI